MEIYDGKLNIINIHGSMFTIRETSDGTIHGSLYCWQAYVKGAYGKLYQDNMYVLKIDISGFSLPIEYLKTKYILIDHQRIGDDEIVFAARKILFEFIEQFKEEHK